MSKATTTQAYTKDS